jgi:AraC-like DNA-binding protein
MCGLVPCWADTAPVAAPRSGASRMTTVITTNGLSSADSTGLWHDAGSGWLGLRDIHAVPDGPIRGRVEANRLGHMLLARLAATGQEIRRTRRHVLTDDVDLFQFAVVRRGFARLEQDDRQAELHRGDCVVYETKRPFTWLFTDDWDVSLFGFPGGAVPLSEPQRSQLTARRLDARATLTGVTSRFLLDLARNSEALPPALAAPTAAAAGDLILVLLADQLGEPSKSNDPAQRTLMLRIENYIQQHHRDPALGPSEIAAAANISTRYLHKLFTAHSYTVSHYVRQVRLAGARKDLQHQALAGRPISAIAYGRGFGDLSGFNRAFRDTYGITPKEMRAAAEDGAMTSTTPARLTYERL